MNDKMEKALNEQINKEYFSSYLYLSMSAYFDSIGLKGFAKWMKAQAAEEKFHGDKFFNYIGARGGRVRLEAIETPQIEWSSPLNAFQHTLEHEQYVTKRINDLARLSRDENDFATESFLKWFIDEQVEEEESANEIIDKLRLFGDKGEAVFVLDKDLGQRVFNEPQNL
ncbi:MAG: ferritin [Pseudomonadota bacterium]